MNKRYPTRKDPDNKKALTIVADHSHEYVKFFVCGGGVRKAFHHGFRLRIAKVISGCIGLGGWGP